MDERWHQHPNFDDVKVRYRDGIGNDTEFYREKVQDIAPAIAANTIERNETGGWTRERTMRKAASIPVTIYYDWIVEWQRKGDLPDMTHPDFHSMVNRLCVQRVKDGDYSKFRV